MKKRLPKSVRIFIRKEKARIRKGLLSLDKQREAIDKLYKDLKIEKPEHLPINR